MITNVGKNRIRDLLSDNFVNSGVGLGVNAAVVADSSLFGGGTTVDSLDTSSGWLISGDFTSASTLASSDYFQEGTGAVGLSASYLIGSGEFYKTITPYDSSDKRTYVWMYLAAVDVLSSSVDPIRITLGTGGFSNANYYDFSYESLTTGWNTLGLATSDISGSIGTGLLESSTDSFKITIHDVANIDMPNLRFDYIRYYEGGTMGITDSLKANTILIGDKYWKSTHQVETDESNGLPIVSAGDSDSSSILLDRFTFAPIDKGKSTEIQIEKYYYID